jgi:hypothetical protein
MRYHTLWLFLIALISACSSSDNVKSGTQGAEISTDSSIELREAEEYVALRNKYTLDRDEIYTEQGWYRLKEPRKSQINGLEYTVMESGDGYLSSRFYGSEWLFHQTVVVRIGERVLSTDPIALNSSAHMSQVISANRVYESNVYSDSAVDGGIPEAIATAPTSDSIVVRFLGGQRQETFVLSRADRQNIVDALRFKYLLHQGRDKSKFVDSIQGALDARIAAERAAERSRFQSKVWVEVNGVVATYFCYGSPQYRKTRNGYLSDESEIVSFGGKPANGVGCKAK